MPVCVGSGAEFEAIADPEAKGIKDWEILDVWSEIAHKHGNYAVVDMLVSAAYELGKQA